MYSRGRRFRCVQNVFSTSNRWERIGGIPSLSRAVYDRTSTFPIFHGPTEIENCLKKFAELTDLDPDAAVNEKHFNPNAYFEDYHMQVDFVELNRKNASGRKRETVMAYVCRLRPRKGTVLLSKVTANNIPVEYIKSINQGQDFTLDDGTTIHAKDYLSEGFLGGNFLSVYNIHTKMWIGLKRIVNHKCCWFFSFICF